MVQEKDKEQAVQLCHALFGFWEKHGGDNEMAEYLRSEGLKVDGLLGMVDRGELDVKEHGPYLVASVEYYMGIIILAGGFASIADGVAAFGALFEAVGDRRLHTGGYWGE